MKEYLTVISRDRDRLRIRIDESAMLDDSILDMARNDPHCLACRLESENPAVLSYDISGLCDLRQFLEQYSFDTREGYRFLLNLFEGAVLSGRAKPLWLQTDTVFCSRRGDRILYAAVPLKAEAWLLQREAMREFVCEIRKKFRTAADYEIPGWLQMEEKAPDFSLPSVIHGLRDLEQQYHPRRFSLFVRRHQEPFRTREDVIVPEIIIKEKEPVREDCALKTQVLGAPPDASAYLTDGTDRYDLPFETMILGRGLQCDIRIADETVSVRHARITRQDDRYYIQDLKSANGTFLNEKPVRRRMRLRSGMEIRLASRLLVFKQ